MSYHMFGAMLLLDIFKLQILNSVYEQSYGVAFSGYYLHGYAVLISTAVVLCILIAFATELLGLRAARILYFRMLRNVIRAPMRYVACCATV
jgi:hypothetical protein